MRHFIGDTVGCETNSIDKDFQMAFSIKSNLFFFFFNKIRIIGYTLDYNKCLKYTLANLALIGK